MTIQQWFYSIAAAGFVAAGILEIIQKRWFFLSSRKYTSKSLKDFSKFDGIVEILFGIALAALNFNAIGRKICLFLVIGAMLLFAAASKEYLKKK